MTTPPKPAAIDTEAPHVMPANPARIATLLSNLSSVTVRVTSASQKASRDKPIRLVAVSKLKPVSDIIALHSPPVNLPSAHLHFAENYLNELLEKSRLLPPSIKWHFVGGLQSNKCVSLARDVRGLWAVESVDSEKKASLLDKGWSERPTDPNLRGTTVGVACGGGEQPDNEDDKKLRIYIQVNTSGEDNKSGVDPAHAAALCRFIRDRCPRLKLQGLMTIGAIARSQATSPGTQNEDFLCLRETRDRVAGELGLDSPDELELSMGMSQDFEGAIALGSDEVRIGTILFGDRPPKAEATIF
ncbi:Alanine racemase family protein [Aspergillus sp. HF37]|nr:Alanine racemase family protein [Aspergillus sp. HF37]